MLKVNFTGPDGKAQNCSDWALPLVPRAVGGDMSHAANMTAKLFLLEGIEFVGRSGPRRVAIQLNFDLNAETEVDGALAPLCLPHVKADLAESGGAVDQELAVGARVAATENLQGADARVHIERDLIDFPAD